MLIKKKKIYLQWKEPFRYKKWKHKNHWNQYPKWRFYASYFFIFAFSSILFTIGMYLLDKFIIHKNLIFSDIVYKSFFMGGLICFLLFIANFDTKKVRLQENGISFYFGGVWTEHKYSEIAAFEIELIIKYTDGYKKSMPYCLNCRSKLLTDKVLSQYKDV